jgi:hypothetical protein
MVTIASSTNYDNTDIGYTNADSNNAPVVLNPGTVLSDRAQKKATL